MGDHRSMFLAVGFVHGPSLHVLKAGLAPDDFARCSPQSELAAAAELDIARSERFATRPVREQVVFPGTRTYFAVFFSERVGLTFSLDNVGLPLLSSKTPWALTQQP